MANEKIRTQIFKHGIKYHEVAKAAGITPSTLSVWLRDELKGERKERITQAINALIKS